MYAQNRNGSLIAFRPYQVLVVDRILCFLAAQEGSLCRALTNVAALKFRGPEHFTSVIPSVSEVYRMYAMLKTSLGTQV